MLAIQSAAQGPATTASITGEVVRSNAKSEAHLSPPTYDLCRGSYMLILILEVRGEDL
jgi:hypothetical protein